MLHNNLSVDSDFADLLSTQKHTVSICDVRDSRPNASTSTYQRTEVSSRLKEPVSNEELAAIQSSRFAGKTVHSLMLCGL